MIIDSFMFGLEYELDLLEIRLEYLSPIVDKFILVEAEFTQLGYEKPLFFDKNKNRFKKYLDKIIHIKLDKPICVGRAAIENNKIFGWENENYQRNQIARAIDANANDLIILSDLDEIPSIESILYYINCGHVFPVSLEQEMFYYYLNTKVDYTWKGSQLVHCSFYKNNTPQDLRAKRKKLPYINNGGWHFSYIGGASAVLNKINSVCETLAHVNYKNTDTIKNYMEANTVHFNNQKLKLVDVPNFIDKNKWSHLIKGT